MLGDAITGDVVESHGRGDDDPLGVRAVNEVASDVVRWHADIATWDAGRVDDLVAVLPLLQWYPHDAPLAKSSDVRHVRRLAVPQLIRRAIVFG